jgi:hypothetical protein
MAKSEVDENMMSRLSELSQNLIAGPVRDSLTKQISAGGTVNADVQSLTLFHEQQVNRARTQAQTAANKE